MEWVCYTQNISLHYKTIKLEDSPVQHKSNVNSSHELLLCLTLHVISNLNLYAMEISDSHHVWKLPIYILYKKNVIYIYKFFPHIFCRLLGIFCNKKHWKHGKSCDIAYWLFMPLLAGSHWVFENLNIFGYFGYFWILLCESVLRICQQKQIMVFMWKKIHLIVDDFELILMWLHKHHVVELFVILAQWKLL